MLSHLAFGSAYMMTLTERLVMDGNSQGLGHDDDNNTGQKKNLFFHKSGHQYHHLLFCLSAKEMRMVL